MKIFLIGMMGSGKSYWCKKIAKKMKCGAYDLDFLIESYEDKTVAEIFAENGEAYFRKAEAKIVRWFGEKKSYIVATGGGTPCFYDNMEWMNKNGITIWIDESVERLVERLKPEKDYRPLIKNLTDEELENFLLAKLKERETYYCKATYRLRNNEINDKGFAQIIRQQEK